MNKIYPVLIVFLIISSCTKKKELKSVNFEELQTIFNKNDNTIRVINFWATWCKPCVEELPYFEKIHQQYADKNVEVILVSLDMKNDLEKSLKPFITKNNIKARVIHLDDPDQNSWIPKVDSDWNGAIPVTIIYRGKSRIFFPESVTYNILEKTIKQFLP